MSNIFDILLRGVYAGNMNDLAWIGATVLQRRGELGLSQGALAMSRKKVIVKRINAIQNLGAMDVLCTDKTGTLTMDHII